MLFQFIRYLQPTSYFTLKNTLGEYIYPNPDFLSESVLQHLIVDTTYKSEYATKLDLAYQAVARGYIGDCEKLKTIKKTPIQDEYHFLRKNFSSYWVFYTFLLRIITLKNPFLEFLGYLKTFKIKRVTYHNSPILYEDWENFDSELLKENPKVSVVIPTLNRYQYLKDVLLDLEKQDYKNFEVIIVDQSEPFQKEFYAHFKLDIQLIHQEEKALWLARNTAIQSSTTEYIALSEDDVRIKSNWISSHLKCLDFFKAPISAGVFFPENKSMPKERSFFQYAFQFATGNAMIKKEVFEKTGLFDRQFEKGRMGDGEFGLRSYLEGFKSVSNPFAYCLDVKADTGGLRQFGSWDAFRTKKLFSPKPMPSVLYLFIKYYGRKKTVLNLLKTIPLSILPYRYKGNTKMMLIVYLLLLVIWPFVILQVCISWSLASKKIVEGAIISKLN